MIDVEKVIEDWEEIPYEEQQVVLNDLAGPKDLLVMNILAKYVDTRKILGAAEHDVVYFECDIETFNDNATAEEATILAACDVFIEFDSFAMYI